MESPSRAKSASGDPYVLETPSGRRSTGHMTRRKKFATSTLANSGFRRTNAVYETGEAPRMISVRGWESLERNSIRMTTVMNVGASTASDARTAGQEAARTIMEGIGDCRPQLCILLASASYDLPAVLEEVRKLTGDTPLMGCSTSSQFTRAGVTQRGVSLALIASDEMEVRLTCVEDWATSPTESVKTALKSLSGAQRRSDTRLARSDADARRRWPPRRDRVSRRTV